MSNSKDSPVLSQFKSYAKINWDLYVFPLQGDSNLHRIDSLVSIIDLHDEIEIEIREGNDVQIFCDVAPGRKNIVWKAAKALLDYVQIKKHVSVKIKKNIPHGAGLGGGSSNAMSVILELVRLLNLSIADSEIIMLSKEIGSDLPIFMNSGWMRVRGFGEKIDRLDLPTKKLVLFKPKESLSTKDVYGEFDNSADTFELPSVPERLKKPYNSLLDPSIRLLPKIKKTIIKLKESGLFKNVSMTGSGSVIIAEPENDEFPETETLKRFNLKHYLTKTICF